MKLLGDRAGPAGPDVLLKYAVLKWPRHVQLHGEEDIDCHLAVLLKGFLGSMDLSSPAFQQWLYHRDEFAYTPQPLRASSTAIFTICSFGFHKVLDDWWQTGPSNLYQRDNNGNLLLHVAVGGGSSNVARQLLELGLDADTCGPGVDGTYALAYAACLGNSRMTQLLLDAGANVNISGGRYGSPLGVAASCGHSNMVQLLCNRGANVNPPVGEYGCLLDDAAYRGVEATVRLLLGIGANVNERGGLYGCPLGAAADSHKFKIAQLLLESGADVNLIGGVYGSPLGTAVFYGAEGIVRLLLLYGADVNLPGAAYGCPLGAAAYWGREAVAQLLLDCGADANLADGEWGCPLSVAAYCGREAMAQLLISRGAGVNVSGGLFGSALGAAAYSAESPCAQLLLGEGADITLRGGHFARRQLADAHNNGGEIVRLNLERTAGRDSDSYALNKALSAAVESQEAGAIDLLRLLLRAWATAPTGRGRHIIGADSGINHLSNGGTADAPRQPRKRRDSA